MKTTCKQLTKLTLGAIGISAIMIAQPGYAQSLGQYTFSGSSPTNLDASIVNSRVTFDPFSASGLTGAGVNSSVYSASGWTANNTADTTKYFQFALQPIAGSTMSLSSVSFEARRSNENGNGNDGGPTSLLLQYAIGNSNTYNDAGTVANVGTSFSNFSVSNLNLLSGLTNTSSKITFRLYGYSAENNLGTLDVDNVSVNGTAVPEPATILGGIAALGVGGAVQRKWQRKRGKAEAKV